MEVLRSELGLSKCYFSSQMLRVVLHLDVDLSHLLPFVNAELPDARFFPEYPFLRFRWQGRVVAIQDREVRIAPVEDDSDARTVGNGVIALLREIEARQEEITPDFSAYQAPSIIELLRLLPRRNGCGRCGHPTCMSFAAAVARGEAKLDACTER